MNEPFRQFGPHLYRRFIEPHSGDVDSRRREFILNTLLSGLFAIACIALVYTLFNHFVAHQGHHLSSVWSTLVFWTIMTALLVISRSGKPSIAAFILVGFLLLSAVEFAFVWGFGLADAELMFALTIVIAGVLFAAPLALAAVSVVAVVLMVITYLQVNHLQTPQTYWQRQSYQIDDAVGYMAIFVVMGLVSWLSNLEIDRSLKRARASEAALQKERDNLEAKVISRTRELEELQLARLLELQPFAEFGRIGAGLVHEIANPLTAASLHLEELNRQQHSDLVRQVQRNLHYLERYLLAARKQIKRESRLKTFSVGSELRQICNLLTNRARSAEVSLIVDKVTNVKLYGDVVKFNQLVANLLANAIDASEKISDRGRRVAKLEARQEKGWVVLVISDHGPGIPPQLMDHLFEPFYSTKNASVRSGLGIGLALVKQYVENDFRGTIGVVSDAKSGTVFTLKLRSQEHS